MQISLKPCLNMLESNSKSQSNHHADVLRAGLLFVLVVFSRINHLFLHLVNKICCYLLLLVVVLLYFLLLIIITDLNNFNFPK